MILRVEWPAVPLASIPRESGDDPYVGELFQLSPEYSPRERG